MSVRRWIELAFAVLLPAVLLLVFVGSASPRVALAASTAAPQASTLSLEEVLMSVRRTHPDLEAAQWRIEERDGQALAARGGFDPVASIRGKWAPVGYYPAGQVDALIRQATPIWGVSAYAGYRLGLGSYAVYKGEMQTLSGGELRAGINVPLWRDGPIDRRRAKIRETEIKVGAAYAQQSADQLAVERDATKAYWSWVAAGGALRVARELLSIAEVRAASLVEQVEAGSVPPLMVTDNRRLVLDRGAKAVAAERTFRAATLSLSLFLRDADLQPIRPSEARLPPGLPAVGSRSLGTVRDAILLALERRPDARVLDAARETAALQIQLAGNQRAPAVDLQAFVAKDFGVGPAELAPTELGLGFTVELALPLRQARGEYRAARARAGRVDAKRRSLRDRIEAEVRDAFVAVEAAEQRVYLAQEQLDVARTLADAERDLLRQGSSDLLAVNLRELAVADAATSEIRALADYHRAQADLVATVGGAPPGEVR